MEQAEPEVASGDFSEENQSEGATENDFRRLFHREGGGRGRGLAAPRAARLATRGEGREHPVGAARVPPKGAVHWGDVGAEIATMACSVHGWWCESPFLRQTNRSLRGRAGAFLPSGSGLEEEAGEGTREDGEVQGQVKAPEEAAQVQQPQVLSRKYLKLRKSCTSQLSNCKMIAHSCPNAGKQADPSCPCKAIHAFFSRLMRFQVDPSKTVSSRNVSRSAIWVFPKILVSQNGW